jgi:tetratricopeptide (TPR) repeat protein
MRAVFERDRSPWQRAVRVSALAAAIALACASPPPEAPTGLVADFDAPKPAAVASLLTASAGRERRGDVEGALHAAERALAIAPRSGAASLREAELRARSAIRAGDDSGLAEARAAIREIASQYPDASAPRLAEARLEFAVGDRAKAEAAAEALVAELPDSAAAHALLSRAVLEDDPRRARELARRAVELAPSDPDALAARALATAGFGAFKEASGDARAALRSRYDPELVAILVEANIRAHDARAGRREAARIIENVPEVDRTVALELLLSEVEIRMGDYAGSAAAVARAEAKAGADEEAQRDVVAASAFLAVAKGTPDEAVESVRDARARAPEDATLAEVEALLEDAMGHPADAEVDARRALELDPESISVWHALARILEEQGVRPADAARLRAAAGGNPARAHALAARLAEQKGDTKQALAEYEAALALDPDLAFAQLGVAELSWEKDAPRALALAEKAQKALGWHGATAKALGVALRANGRASEAVDVLEIGIGRIEPGHPASLALQVALAYALQDSGEEASALRLSNLLVRSGEKMDPQPSWLASIRALREELQGEPVEAKAGGESHETTKSDAPEKASEKPVESASEKPAAKPAESASEKPAESASEKPAESASGKPVEKLAAPAEAPRAQAPPANP